MRKLITILLGGALFAAAFAAGAALTPAEPAGAGTTTARTATTGTTTERGDDRGGRVGHARVRRQAGEDVRGPCDEAEHRNDPRCTVAAGARRADDDSGRRRGRDHDDDGDRSGSNRGRG